MASSSNHTGERDEPSRRTDGGWLESVHEAFERACRRGFDGGFADFVARRANLDPVLTSSPGAPDETITSPQPASDGAVQPETACEPPVQIPNHELLRLLGKGGFGQVWLARNTYTEHFRAAKLFRRDTPLELDGLRTLKQRVGEHPHLLAIEDVGAAGDWLYALMPLADNANGSSPVVVPGDYQPLTLRIKLNRAGHLPAREAAQIGAALADALAHLHECGAVHADVKPGNVIRHGGAWKLTDYGLMRRSEDESSGRGFTRGYCPPEGPGTPAADQYALGVLLSELLTGVSPHESLVPQRALQELTRGVAPALTRAIKRCIAKDKSQRFPSMKDVADALRNAGGAAVEIAPPRRGAWIWIGAIAAAVIAMIAFANGIWPKPIEPMKGHQTKRAMAGDLRIDPLALEHYRYDDYRDPNSAGRLLGRIGVDSWAVVGDDGVQLATTLSQPAYYYLLVFDTNGSVSCKYPRQDGVPPDRLAAARYPGGNVHYHLTDGPGLQAFAVVASREPLPRYADWPGRALLEAAWRSSNPGSFAANTPTVWTSDGQAIWRQEPGNRGIEMEHRTAPGAMEAVARQLAGDPAFDAVRVIAMPVRPREP